MTCWKWNDQTFEPCNTLPLEDRGFRYGMALFETIKLWNGTAQFLKEHLERLRSACEGKGFPVAEQAFEESFKLLSATSANGVARIYVTAGAGSPLSKIERPSLIILIEERREALPESYQAVMCEDPYRAPFGGLKTANYWFNIDAIAHAHMQKADEALLFNDLGELVSSAMANVFLVRDGIISTPARSTGCRDGVVREWVIKRGGVVEKRLRREDVLKADEVFLTSSWLGIMPVSSIEGRPLGPRSKSPRLAARLEEYWNQTDNGLE